MVLPDLRKRPPTSGSWKPGQTGNAKGRPKSGYALAEAIRSVVNPEEMAQIAWDLARGKCSTLGQSADGWQPIVEAPTRIAALNWLASNGYIKPVTEIATNAPAARAIDFSRLPPEDVDAFARLLEKASGGDVALPSATVLTEE